MSRRRAALLIALGVFLGSAATGFVVWRAMRPTTHIMGPVQSEAELLEELKRRDLEAALDADPYHSGAAKALVKLFDELSDNQRLVWALQRLGIAADTPAEQADAELRRGVIAWRELEDGGLAETAFRVAVRVDDEDLHDHSSWSKSAVSPPSSYTSRSSLFHIGLRFVDEGCGVLVPP